MSKPIVLHYSFSSVHDELMTQLLRGELTVKQAEKKQRDNAKSFAYGYRLKGYKVKTDSHIESCSRVHLESDTEPTTFTGRVYMVHVTYNS
jgi:hypothetical protein